ncbi:MAG: hypothetical protein V3R41_06525 [Gammaproteobacteria bacterium]
MAQKDKATLTALFETGDTPDGTDFADLIDSNLNLVNSTAQSMGGPLITTNLGAAVVSAVEGQFNTVFVSAGLSARNAEFGTLAVSGQSTLGNVSANAMVVTGIVSAEEVVATSGKFGSLTVSADTRLHGDLVVDGVFAVTQGEVGELFISATASVSASAVAVEFIANATSDSTFLVNFEVSANRLVYKGAATRSFLVIANIAVESSQNNTHTELCIAVNSSAQPRTISEAIIGTDVVNLAVHGMVSLAPEDTVSMTINNDPGTAVGYNFHRINFTVKD